MTILSHDFIKIDVEGGESELLPAMLPYLREHRPTLLLSTHFRFIPESEHDALNSAIEALLEIYPQAQRPDRGTLKNKFASLIFNRNRVKQDRQPKVAPQREA